MEKYIKKFPYGKFFSFTEAGSGVSSGDDKSEVEPIPITNGANGYKPNIEHVTGLRISTWTAGESCPLPGPVNCKTVRRSFRGIGAVFDPRQLCGLAVS